MRKVIIRIFTLKIIDSSKQQQIYLEIHTENVARGGGGGGGGTSNISY